MTGLHDALAALAERGTGTDLNPTRLVGDPEIDRFWSGYVTELDQRWRDRIRALLAEYEPTPADQALREDVTPSGVAAIRMAADNLPLGRPGQPWAGAADWLHRRADGIEQHLLASSAPATASEGATLSDSVTDSVTASEGATECDSPNYPTPHQPGVLPDHCTACANEVTSSDGDRGLSEEERRSLGCQCTRLDDVWHHGRHCPVPAVERTLAAHTAQPVEDTAGGDDRG